jgi:hypothetical protein
MTQVSEYYQNYQTMQVTIQPAATLRSARFNWLSGDSNSTRSAVTSDRLDDVRAMWQQISNLHTAHCKMTEISRRNTPSIGDYQIGGAELLFSRGSNSAFSKCLSEDSRLYRSAHLL